MANPTPEGETFEIHVIGVATGQLWPGKFRAKALMTFREQMAADKMRREFTGPDVVDSDIFAQATILSELAFKLTETPEWWKTAGNGLDLKDPNVLKEVYDGVKKIEKAHFDKLKAAAEASRGAVKAELEKPPTA